MAIAYYFIATARFICAEGLPTMEVSLLRVADRVKQLKSSKLLLDERFLATRCVVSPRSIASLATFTLDNASTAQKDGRLTLRGVIERAKKHGHANTTIAHMVDILGTIIRNTFHIFHLTIKHFSETACGIRDKAIANEDTFHCQVRTICKKILTSNPAD